jgi:4-hydroxy-tetrahydrodipicolinate synthase
MVHAWLAGRTEEAASLQLELLPLIRALFSDANPIPVKAAVAWLGFDVGEPRAPLVSAEADVRGRVIAELQALGIAPGARAAT